MLQGCTVQCGGKHLSGSNIIQRDALKEKQKYNITFIVKLKGQKSIPVAYNFTGHRQKSTDEDDDNDDKENSNEGGGMR